MEITIKKYDSLTGYRIELNKVSKEERIKIENATRDSFLKKIHNIFYDYQQVLEAYNYGYINLTQKEKCCNDLYDKSGYEDIYDFLYDFKRWKLGLPIYIHLKLI